MRRCVSSVKQDLRSSYNSLFTKRRKLTFNSSFSDKIQCMQEESPSLLSKKKFLQSVLAIVKKSQIGILSSKTNNKKKPNKRFINKFSKRIIK